MGRGLLGRGDDFDAVLVWRRGDGGCSTRYDCGQLPADRVALEFGSNGVRIGRSEPVRAARVPRRLAAPRRVVGEGEGEAPAEPDLVHTSRIGRSLALPD